MKKNVFQRLWEWILSLFPKQEIEIPKPKEEEPIPEEPKGVLKTHILKHLLIYKI